MLNSSFVENKALLKSIETAKVAAAAGMGFYAGLGLLIFSLVSTVTLPPLFLGTACTEAGFIGLVCLVLILVMGIPLFPLFRKYGGQFFDHIIHKGIEVFFCDNKLTEMLEKDCDMCRSDKAGKREFIWGSLMGFGIGGFIGLLVCAASSADLLSVPWFVWLGTALFVVALLWLACHLVVDLYRKQIEQIPGIGSGLLWMMSQMHLRFDPGCDYALVSSSEECNVSRPVSLELPNGSKVYASSYSILEGYKPCNDPLVPTISKISFSDGSHFSYVPFSDKTAVDSSDAVLVFNS